MICTYKSHCGYSPRSIASKRSFDAEPRSLPCTLAASSAVRLATPQRGWKWYFTSTVSPCGVHHLVGVDAEALHVPVAGRNAARAEQVRQHVHRFRRLAHEVEDAVRLLAEGDRVRLQRVDDVRELDRVADEEDRQVVADQIPVAVLGVELHREAARIARRLRRVAAADHGREADGERRLLARLLEQLGAGVLGGRLVADLAGRLELAVADEAARVDDALGDALAVEVA